MTPSSTRELAARSPLLFALGGFAWQVGLVVLLLLLSWNGRGDRTYAWCVILAVIPALTAILSSCTCPGCS